MPGSLRGILGGIYSCGGLPVMESGKVKAAAVSACWMKKTLI